MLTWPNIFILFLLFFLLRSFLRSHHVRAKARALGCEAPYSVASGPFSIFLVIRSIFRLVHAAWSGGLHVYLRSSFDRSSVQAGYRVKTISQQASRLLTYDEANVHAILTTLHHEFNPGTREKSFRPMLGEHSIVSVLIFGSMEVCTSTRQAINIYPPSSARTAKIGNKAGI